MKLFNLKNSILYAFLVYVGIYFYASFLTNGYYTDKYNAVVIYSLITALFYFAIILLAVYQKKFSKTKLLIFTFVVTFLLVMGNNYLFFEWGHTSFYFGAEDAVTYDALARKMVHLNFLHKLNFISSVYSFPDFGQPIFLSYVYSIIEAPIFVDVIYIFVNLVSVLLLYKIGGYFLSKRYAFLGSLIYGVSLYTTFYISSGLKEPLMLYLSIQSIYLYVRFQDKRNSAYVISAAFVALPIMLFRPGITMILFLTFFIQEFTNKKFNLKKIVLVLCMIGGLALLYFQFINEFLFYLHAQNSALVGSNFGQVVAFFSQLFGPFPTVVPYIDDIKSMYSASLILKMYLSLHFIYACFYAFKAKNNYMKTVVIFVLIQIAGLIFLSELGLRTSMTYIPFVILLSMFTFANYRSIIKGIHQYIYGVYYIVIPGIIFFWNYLRL